MLNDETLKTIYGQKALQYFNQDNSSPFVFTSFSPLELGIRSFGPENQILHEKTFLEPDGHVWKPPGFHPTDKKSFRRISGP